MTRVECLEVVEECAQVHIRQQGYASRLSYVDFLSRPAASAVHLCTVWSLSARGMPAWPRPVRIRGMPAQLGQIRCRTVLFVGFSLLSMHQERTEPSLPQFEHTEGCMTRTSSRCDMS